MRGADTGYLAAKQLLKLRWVRGKLPVASPRSGRLAAACWLDMATWRPFVKQPRWWCQLDEKLCADLGSAVMVVVDDSRYSRWCKPLGLITALDCWF